MNEAITTHVDFVNQVLPDFISVNNLENESKENF